MEWIKLGEGVYQCPKCQNAITTKRGNDTPAEEGVKYCAICGTRLESPVKRPDYRRR